MNKLLAITVLIVFALLVPARAQGPAPSLVGNWQGTVTFGPQTLRIGLVITADGRLFGEGAEILTVVRTANGWKIAGNMARQLSQYGKSSLSSFN